MSLDAVLFDLDGTLVNTNLWHARAWQHAMEEAGYKLPLESIAAQIGKGGDQLVPTLLGEKINAEIGEELGKACVQKFLQFAAENKIQVFPCAAELVQACRDRGLKTALATSGEKSTLKAIEESSGVAWHQLFDVVVTAADIAKSKPAPDVLQVTADRLGLSPLQCALVGDTEFDALSARHSGVSFLGVRSGGHDATALTEAGGRGLFEHTGDLLGQLDQALRGASPGALRLTRARQEILMARALEAAREGMKRGEVPIGSALFDGSGRFLSAAFNRMNATQNKTAHAEIMAFAAAAGKVPLDDKTLILVSTLEPCVMCTGAAMEAGVDVVLYGLKAPQDSGTSRVDAPRSPESQMPRIVGEVCARDSRELLDEWLAANAGTPQSDYVRQLLAN